MRSGHLLDRAQYYLFSMPSWGVQLLRRIDNVPPLSVKSLYRYFRVHLLHSGRTRSFCRVECFVSMCNGLRYATLSIFVIQRPRSEYLCLSLFVFSVPKEPIVQLRCKRHHPRQLQAGIAFIPVLWERRQRVFCFTQPSVKTGNKRVYCFAPGAAYRKKIC